MDEFKTYIPIEIVKGKEAGKGGKRSKMVFRGIASTADEDMDGEILDPNGFVYDTFLKAGSINWNHQATSNPLAIIGEPTAAFVKDGNFEIEGFLYDDSDLAKKVYNLAETLEKCSPNRRLGFSIEGKAIKRNPLNKKKVEKAEIYNVAIAPMPKNYKSRMELVKAFSYDAVESVIDNAIVDVVADGMRIIVDEGFSIHQIDVINNNVISKAEFEATAVSVYKAKEDGSISDADYGIARDRLSKAYSIFDGMAWVIPLK